MRRISLKNCLGCLWRESVDPVIGTGEQALSQAALLHRDINGQSILAVLIQASGLSPITVVKTLCRSICYSALNLLVQIWLGFFSTWGKYHAYSYQWRTAENDTERLY